MVSGEKECESQVSKVANQLGNFESKILSTVQSFTLANKSKISLFIYATSNLIVWLFFLQARLEMTYGTHHT